MRGQRGVELQECFSWQPATQPDRLALPFTRQVARIACVASHTSATLFTHLKCNIFPHLHDPRCRCLAGVHARSQHHRLPLPQRLRGGSEVCDGEQLTPEALKWGGEISERLRWELLFTVSTFRVEMWERRATSNGFTPRRSRSVCFPNKVHLQTRT